MKTRSISIVMMLAAIIAASFLFISCPDQMGAALIPNNGQPGDGSDRAILAVDDSGEIIETKNGISWSSKNNVRIRSLSHIIQVSSKSSPSGNRSLSTDTVLVGTTLNDIYYSLDNGHTWSFVKTVEGIKDIAYSDGIFLIVGGGTGFIERSVDGINWETKISEGSFITSVAFGPEIIVATGHNDRLLVSHDSGETWQDGNLGDKEQARFASIIYAPNKFVAVGNAINGLSSRWATSVDGINWENITVDPNYILMQDISYGMGTYVTGGYHFLLTSKDGITWENEYRTDANIKNINFSNGVFVASGLNTFNGYPMVLISNDSGLTWTEIDVSELVDEPIIGGSVEYFDNPHRYLTSVDGRIVNNEGEGIPDAFILLYDIDINTNEFIYSDENGYFNIYFEHNGDLDVLVISDDYKNQQFTLTTSSEVYDLNEIIMEN